MMIKPRSTYHEMEDIKKGQCPEFPGSRGMKELFLRMVSQQPEHRPDAEEIGLQTAQIIKDLNSNTF